MQQMQYSFSQTFGKGANILQGSPTPSIYRQDELNQRQSDHSPVIESYRMSDGVSQKNRQQYISTLRRQTQQLSQHARAKQKEHKLAQEKIKSQIKNVDGLNERMVNLINELKRDNSLNIIKRNQKTNLAKNDNKQNEIHQQLNKKNAHSLSNQIIRSKTNLNYQTYGSKQKYKQEYLDKFTSKTSKGVQQKNKNQLQQKIKKYQDRMNQKIVTDKRPFYNVNSKENVIKNDKQKLISSVDWLKSNEQHKSKEIIGYKNQKTKSQKYPQEIIFNMPKLNQGNSQFNRFKKLGQSHQQSYSETRRHQNYFNISKKVGSSYQELYSRFSKNLQHADKCKSLALLGQLKLNEGKKQNWLKCKVKTIQSQIQTNCNQFQQKREVNEFSYIDENVNIAIKQHPNEDIETIYNGLYESRQKDEWCVQCGLQKKSGSKNKQNWNQEIYASISFQKKIRNMSQKIENYQKKVSQMNLEGEKFTQTNREHYKIIEDIEMSSGKSRSLTPMSFRQKQQKFMIKKQLTKLSTIENNVEDYSKHHERKLTPTWGYRQIENVNTLQNQYVANKSEQIPKFKQVNNKYNGHYPQQEIKSQSFKFRPIEEKNSSAGNSVKQRINLKLQGSNIAAQKLMRQIVLDEQFRKSKKQLSKIPEYIPGFPNDKWKSIWLSLKQKNQQYANIDIEKTFELKDEQADPFFSIAVEDLRDFNSIIMQVVESYRASQDHFRQQIMFKLPYSQLIQIFPNNKDNNDLIKLDQFAACLSNTTKSNHKCRDVYLLFQKIKEAFGSESLTRDDILQIFTRKNQTEEAASAKISKDKKVLYQIQNSKKTQNNAYSKKNSLKSKTSQTTFELYGLSLK